MNSKKSSVFYSSLIVIQCIFWGLGNSFIKISSEEITPLYFLAFRYFISFALFMIFFGKRIINKLRTSDIVPSIVISAFTSISFACGVYGLLLTSATNAGFLMSLAVIFTPFLSFFMLKMPIKARHLLPIVIVVIGLYLICYSEGVITFGLGEVCALLSSITIAVVYTISSKLLKDMDAVVLSTLQCIFCGIFCLVFAMIFEEFVGFKAISLEGWAVILYLAIGCTFIAYLLQNIALTHISPTLGSLAFCTEPIFTAISAYILLGERLTARGVLGSGVIIVAIILATLMPQERKAKVEL